MIAPPARAQQPPPAPTSAAPDHPQAISYAALMFAPGVNPNEVMQRVEWSDMPLESVLQALEDLTGRIVLRPQALPAAQVTINAKQDLTRAEVLFAVETVLSLNGIGIVPVEDKFVKVVPIESVRTEAPELVVGSLRDEPASGKVVSKLFRLQYLDSTSFQQQIAPFLGPRSGTVATFQNSNAVIVTDTVANLQRLEYLLGEVDRRLNIETKFYQILYANASELSQAIRSMIDSARAGLTGNSTGMRSGAAPTQPTGAPQGGAAAGGAVPLQVIVSSNISISADERTNQLIVIADPANLPFFDNLIAKLDIPAEPPTSIEVIPMKYANATELASLLSQVVSGRGSGSSRTNGRTPTATRQRSTPFPNLSQQNQGSNAQQRQQATENALQAAAAAEGTSQFSDYMTILADERSNAVIVSGTNTDLALMRRVIGDLDVLLAQVRIDAIIAEVSLTDTMNRGIDAFGGFTYDGGEVGFNGDIGGIAAAVTGTWTSGRLIDITLDGIIEAARVNSDINLLAVPTIVTTHNKEASIILGEARPIVSSTQTSLNTSAGSAYSQFTFQDIGIQLKLKPTIGPNDVVQLEIDQKIDDIGPKPAIINGEEQPIIIRRQATSFLSVKNGQMIVLGGLQKNATTTTKSRMPFLGEIPLLGSVFTRHDNEKSKTELLLFIKPTVIRTTDDAHLDAASSLRDMEFSDQNRQRLSKVSGEDLTPAADERRRNASEVETPVNEPGVAPMPTEAPEGTSSSTRKITAPRRPGSI